MKLLGAISLFSLASVAFAQSVEIGYPPAGTSVQPGESITVQIVQPNSIEGSWTVGIAIAVQSCVNSPCSPPADIMGSVLYNGPFNPQLYHTIPYTPPFENFTVQIPTYLPDGPAQLNVAYAALWGAAPAPSFETLNETLVISST